MTSKQAREYKGVATKKGSSSTSGSLVELILIVAVALGLALGIQAFLVKPYRIPSESMVPTLQIGQRVLVNRIGERFTSPDVGDVVVFHPPAGAEQDNTCGSGQPPAGQVCDTPTDDRADVNFIKRVVAGPGDKLRIEGGKVILNGKPAGRAIRAALRGRRGLRLPDRDHDSSRALLHDGRQPWLL